MRVLVIQYWIRELQPIRDALRDAGLQAEIVRADFEPALHAALARGPYDVVIFDPEIPGLSRRVVEAAVAGLPIVVLEDVASLGARIQAALLTRRAKSPS
jgi:DNA-binding response OmpR family regulator